MEQCFNQFYDFSITQQEHALTFMKILKASGLDGITKEIIKHFGHKTKSCILQLNNKFAETSKMPLVGEKPMLLLCYNQGKIQYQKKKYRPIFLLYIMLQAV